ncbi:MAG: aromatic ring-hydroxylating dioxygenase subunit alpha [Novosphingobium sp.]|nr:aromatic ring-hydroxylating dioxygenase subunit alpha [Novosphingobium sp.]
MPTARPGECIDTAPHIEEIDYSDLKLQVTTDRYYSPEYHEREREQLWMRVWQVAARADELPEAGDWMEYRIFDQSFVLVRGKDGQIRGFVNACRHRGNAFCEGKGHSPRFTCPYHNWSYGLDGQLLAVAKPDFDGTVEEFVGNKDELGLIRVPVEVFAGFIFINPDRNAPPLAEFLGEAGPVLEAFHLDEMVPVGMNVRETINCNWKVVMDAFYESYHVQAVHPELIPIMDLSKERYCRLGNHGATTVPFQGTDEAETDHSKQIEAFRNIPKPNFPGLAEVFPRFEELVASYSKPDGSLAFPEGISGRLLFQQAARESLTGKGLDVSGLTDNQMSDFEFWSLFPNVYIQLRAGESTVIIARPHPDGDPNRCYWRVAHYIWLPPEERDAQRTEMTDIPEGGHVPYFLALEQDFSQMEDQQKGLRNSSLTHMTLTRQEPKVAQFHTVLDCWMA